MIRVHNNTGRVIGFGGARIAPGTSEKVDRKQSDAVKHPFFKEGWLSIERSGGTASKKVAAKKDEDQTGDQGGGSGDGDSGGNDEGGGGE